MYKSQAYVSVTYPRTTAETLVFWTIAVFTLIPTGYFLFLSIMFEELLVLPFILLQLGVNSIALTRFLNTKTLFSTSLLWLIGGTCIIYALFITGFFIILVTLHSH
jgi:hypothetical protein